jgi:hypothetical protein
VSAKEAAVRTDPPGNHDAHDGPVSKRSRIAGRPAGPATIDHAEEAEASLLELEASH